MPAVAALRYEEHPLSYANISTPDKKGRSVFIIRAYDGGSLSVGRKRMKRLIEVVRVHSAVD